MFSNFVVFVSSFENTERRGLGQFKQNSSSVSFQHGVLESRLTWMFTEASSRTWMPAIHAGMTNPSSVMLNEEKHRRVNSTKSLRADREECLANRTNFAYPKELSKEQ